MRELFRPLSSWGGWLGLIVLVLLALEGTVRLDDWARFGVPLSNEATALEDLLVRDSLGQHARPNAHYKHFQINALGFRGEDTPPSVLGKRELVFTSGASETFGLYETKGHEWPLQLQDSLRPRCAAREITVLNAAFAGMTLPTVIQDVRLRLLPLRPAVIMYYPTPSQYLFHAIPRVSLPDSLSPKRLSRWRLRTPTRLRDALIRSLPQPVMELLRRADTKRARASGETTFAEVPVERLDSMDAQLRSLVGEIRRGGAQAVLVLPTNRFRDTTAIEERRFLRSWERLTPKATGAILLRFGDLANQRIVRVAADSSVALVDPTQALRENAPSMYADFAHFTDLGSAILAGAAATKLAFVLGCATLP